MTTPSGEYPWEAANATDGLAWYAGQGIGDWKLKMAENVFKSFLSIGLFALRVPFTDDLADAVIGPDKELEGEIPSLVEVGNFLQGKWDLLDDISGAVQPIIDVFTAVLKAFGGDFSGLADLPRLLLDRLAGLFGGAAGLPVEDVFAGLESLFSGLFSDGGLDARRLIGSIFPWLLPNVPYQHISDESLNLVAEHDFAAAITIAAGVAGWSWDGGHGYDPEGTGKLGCAAVEGNGTEQTLTMLSPVTVSEAQVLRLAGRASWQWVTGTIPAGAQLVLDAFNAGEPVSRVPVAALTVTGTQPVWQELTGDWTVPAGVDSVAVTLLVPATLTDGTVRFDSITLHKVQKMKLEWTGQLVERFQFLAGLFNILDIDLDGPLDPAAIWNALWTALLRPLDWIPIVSQSTVDQIINAWQNLGDFVDQDLDPAGILESVFGIFNVGLNANTRTAAVEARIRALESAANTIVEEFAGASASSLGGAWSQNYSGGGAGNLGLDGQGNAVWKQSGFGNRACMARYTTAVLNTDAQIMPGVNEAISATVQAVGDIITSNIQYQGYGIGAQGGAIDAILRPIYSDTILAFMAWKSVLRANAAGWSHYAETFQTGADKAFTISALMVMRAGFLATEQQTSYKLQVVDGAPYFIGDAGQGHFWLGDRIGATIRGMPKGRIYVDQVYSLALKWDRDTAPNWLIGVGKDKQLERGPERAMRHIQEFAADLQQAGLF